MKRSEQFKALKNDASRFRRTQAIERLNRKYIACHSCDTLWERPELEQNERAVCGRCHTTIVTKKAQSTERTAALMLSSLILYMVAISFPFMRMERSGVSNQISVLDAVGILITSSMPLLAIVCAALILVFPLTRILLLLYVVSTLMRGQPANLRHAISFKLALKLEPWTMAEIFMIGVIISLVKVGKLADISLGPAFWGMSALIVILAYSSSALCRDTFWSEFRRSS